MAALSSKTWFPRCAEVTVGRNGLTVAFACLQAALGKFCSPVIDSLARLEAQGSRVFTLLPSRDSFGLFSALPVNTGHFNRFGKCLARNCAIWFPSKHAMVRALRDPFIQRTYPALWIDCRNIFILHKSPGPPPARPPPPPPGITCPQLASLLEQCRRTADRLGHRPRHGHIPSARLARTGYQQAYLHGPARAPGDQGGHGRFLASKLLLLRELLAAHHA